MARTKGPWKYEDEYVRNETGEAIADPFVMEDIPEEEMIANARLMAAAPDLLRACKEVLFCMRENGSVLPFTEDMVRDAIAKAGKGTV